MKVYVDLTENDKRALSRVLFYGERACQGTCVYDEMATSKLADCKNCCYVKGLDSLRRKFSNPKSLADYTKQVRKEVCEKIRENAISHNNLEVDMYYITPQQLYEIEQGESNGRLD